ALFDDAHLWVDRRKTVSGPTATGFDEMLESVHAIIDVGFVQRSFEPLAVRGDRSLLARVTLRTADEHVMTVVSVWEVDPNGLAADNAWYDEDDLASAVRDLDERFLVGEGAADADLYRHVLEQVRRHRAYDWDGYRELLSDDFVLVDHRSVALPETDREGFLD